MSHNNLQLVFCSLRTNGSTVFQLCMVGEGTVDGLYEDSGHCWDYAAGVLIVTEAGGVVMDIGG